MRPVSGGILNHILFLHETAVIPMASVPHLSFICSFFYCFTLFFTANKNFWSTYTTQKRSWDSVFRFTRFQSSPFDVFFSFSRSFWFAVLSLPAPLSVPMCSSLRVQSATSYFFFLLIFLCFQPCMLSLCSSGKTQTQRACRKGSRKRRRFYPKT